jgi:hypothetical protein
MQTYTSLCTECTLAPCHHIVSIRDNVRMRLFVRSYDTFQLDDETTTQTLTSHDSNNRIFHLETRMVDDINKRSSIIGVTLSIQRTKKLIRMSYKLDASDSWDVSVNMIPKHIAKQYERYIVDDAFSVATLPLGACKALVIGVPQTHSASTAHPVNVNKQTSTTFSNDAYLQYVLSLTLDLQCVKELLCSIPSTTLTYVLSLLKEPAPRIWMLMYTHFTQLHNDYAFFQHSTTIILSSCLHGNASYEHSTLTRTFVSECLRRMRNVDDLINCVSYEDFEKKINSELTDEKSRLFYKINRVFTSLSHYKMLENDNDTVKREQTIFNLYVHLTTCDNLKMFERSRYWSGILF